MLTSELFNSSKLKYFLYPIAGLILLFILSYVYYLIEQKEIKKERHNELTIIAKLKFEQIVDWKNETLYEVKLYSQIDRLVKSSLSIINNQNYQTSKEYLNQLFNPTILNHNYENVFITDTNGKIAE